MNEIGIFAVGVVLGAVIVLAAFSLFFHSVRSGEP